MWKEKALKHAKIESPAEACGLIVIIKGKETFLSCVFEKIYEK